MNKGKSGRWKGAGLGMYYCSLCLCERGNLELTEECPECHAQLGIPKDVLLLQELENAFEQNNHLIGGNKYRTKRIRPKIKRII